MARRMKLKLNLQRLGLLRDGLMALESGDKVDRVNGEVKVVREPFKLGALRFDIAKNLSAVRKVLLEFDDGKDALIRELSGGASSITPDHENWSKFESEVNKRLKVEEEVPLVAIPRSKLNLDVNAIPLVALSAIMDIIDDDEEKEEKEE